MTTSRSNRRAGAGYTLLEILLAIGVVAILLGITVPMIMESFGHSPAELAEAALAKTATAARSSALETGEARKVFIRDRGLTGEISGIPEAVLPAGWKLQVRRMTESKFRRPAKNEVWEFNGAGICEPLTLLAGDGLESVTLTFDPLTALVVQDE